MKLSTDTWKATQSIYPSLSIKYPYCQEDASPINAAINLYSIISESLSLKNHISNLVNPKEFTNYKKVKSAEPYFNAHYHISENAISEKAPTKIEEEIMNLFMLANYLKATISIQDEESKLTFFTPSFEIQSFPYILTLRKSHSKYFCLLPANICMKYEEQNHKQNDSQNFICDGQMYGNSLILKRQNAYLFEKQSMSLASITKQKVEAVNLLFQIKANKISLINSYCCFKYSQLIYELKSAMNQSSSYAKRSLLAAMFRRSQTQLAHGECSTCQQSTFITKLFDKFQCSQCIQQDLLNPSIQHKMASYPLKLSLAIILA
jgi:hypothetical protein